MLAPLLLNSNMEVVVEVGRVFGNFSQAKEVRDLLLRKRGTRAPGPRIHPIAMFCLLLTYFLLLPSIAYVNHHDAMCLLLPTKACYSWLMPSQLLLVTPWLLLLLLLLLPPPPPLPLLYRSARAARGLPGARQQRGTAGAFIRRQAPVCH